MLKNSSDVKLRADIQRGQAWCSRETWPARLREFNKALEVNKNSSLAHYRIAEVFFLQNNYQASANAYRDALNGDGDPRWTEVWSHIQLGKIFDITGQRERATNEYRQALQTNDNTQGALDEARKYLQKPYEQQKSAPARMASRSLLSQSHVCRIPFRSVIPSAREGSRFLVLPRVSWRRQVPRSLAPLGMTCVLIQAIGK